MGIYILNIQQRKPLQRIVIQAEDSLQAIEIGLQILQKTIEKPLSTTHIHYWLATEDDSELGFFTSFIEKINRLEKQKHELNKIH